MVGSIAAHRFAVGGVFCFAVVCTIVVPTEVASAVSNHPALQSDFETRTI